MTLEAGGLWAAMRWLNDREPYRYTVIFAFDGDMLRNICLIDKESQNITNCSDQPITDLAPVIAEAAFSAIEKK